MQAFVDNVDSFLISLLDERMQALKMSFRIEQMTDGAHIDRLQEQVDSLTEKNRNLVNDLGESTARIIELIDKSKQLEMSRDEMVNELLAAKGYPINNKPEQTSNDTGAAVAAGAANVDDANVDDANVDDAGQQEDAA